VADITHLPQRLPSVRPVLNRQKNLYLFGRGAVLLALVLATVACQGGTLSPASPTSEPAPTHNPTPEPTATFIVASKPTPTETVTLEPSPTFTSTPEATATSTPTPGRKPTFSPTPETSATTGPPVTITTAPEVVATPTSEATPATTAELAAETPVEETPVDTSDPLFIDSLRQYRPEPPPTLEVLAVLAETETFTRYQIAYHSDELSITGVMNVPQQDNLGLADDGPPFPVILLNHGHFNPANYTPGQGTQLEADYLAAHGYVTIASDYRGYAGSGGEAGGHFDPGWTYDVLDLLDALPSLAFVDPERVGMWGHSTGGEIALRIITARDSIGAVVLFGSMGADAADNLRLVQGWGGGQAVVERYGLPEDAPEVWAKLSPMTYLADVSSPIAIHHGDLDNEVPPQLSARLWQAMQAADLPGEYYTYPDQGHFFQGAAWAQAMRRTVDFFDRYVKAGEVRSLKAQPANRSGPPATPG
jgi:uncharacterized protein